MATYNEETKVWSGRSLPYPYPLNVYLGEEILKNLDETPDRVLQICHEEGVETTCEQMKQRTIRVAQNLTLLGIQADDVVGFICRNSENIKPLVFGCIVIGAPLSSLDVMINKDDIKQMYGQTKPKLLFCDNNVYETAKAALHELQNDAKIFTILQKIEGVPFVDELFEATDTETTYFAPKFEVDASKKLLAILCSSGTTGPAKGVCLSHTTNALSFAKLFEFPIPYRSLCFSPIFWGSGFYSTILSPFRLKETRVVTRNPFSVELFVELVEKYKINIIYCAPTEIALLLQSNLVNTADLSSIMVFVCFGNIVNEQLREKFNNVFPNKLLVVSFALSEISVTLMMPGDSLDGLTTGQILPNIQVKVVDENGASLGTNEKGEILAKSQFEFLGYYNNPEGTKNAVDSDGFVKTGDRGFVDDKGCVFIIDRIKDIFKYGGYHINPSEIENVIESIEGVEMTAVVGIPDSYAANLTAAVIVRRSGFEHQLTEETVLKHVASMLPHYKQLHGGVYFVDKLPMTLSGKIQKRFVKEIAISKYTLKFS